MSTGSDTVIAEIRGIDQEMCEGMLQIPTGPLSFVPSLRFASKWFLKLL